jgi:antitoxin component YwqK of YwqJK toxin-antitoxin module
MVKIFWIIIISTSFIGCKNSKKDFYNNGNIRAVIELDASNNCHGEAKYFYIDGKLEKTQKYEHGTLLYSIDYYKNGRIKFKDSYCNDTLYFSQGWDSLGNCNYEYVRLDTNKIPAFENKFIRFINGNLSNQNFTKIKLEIPSIPSYQLYPAIVNGEFKVYDRIKGIWEVKSYDITKPTYIGIVIFIDNNHTFTIGYNKY